MFLREGDNSGTLVRRYRSSIDQSFLQKMFEDFLSQGAERSNRVPLDQHPEEGVPIVQIQSGQGAF